MKKDNDKRMIAIVGPTAVGKTSTAIRVAKMLDTEIISCDSMQIYKGMDIGTAKPTPEERKAVLHHMVDIAEPFENYSCADYARAARELADGLLARGKTPIFCGGTGLYLESVFYESGFSSPEASPEIRESLLKESAEDNYRRLCEVDPASAEKIHPNNRKRVIRALEVYLSSGKTKTEWDIENKAKGLIPFAEIYVLTSSDRDMLYKRIDDRVDEMMAAGLLDEAVSLSLSPDTTAGQAIGYKELYAYINGECSLAESVELIKKASRNYAKRQLTWWERNKDAVKLDISCGMTPELAAEAIASGELWKNKTKKA